MMKNRVELKNFTENLGSFLAIGNEIEKIEIHENDLYLYVSKFATSDVLAFQNAAPEKDMSEFKECIIPEIIFVVKDAVIDEDTIAVDKMGSTTEGLTYNQWKKSAKAYEDTYYFPDQAFSYNTMSDMHYWAEEKVFKFLGYGLQGDDVCRLALKAKCSGVECYWEVIHMYKDDSRVSIR